MTDGRAGLRVGSIRDHSGSPLFHVSEFLEDNGKITIVNRLWIWSQCALNLNEQSHTLTGNRIGGRGGKNQKKLRPFSSPPPSLRIKRKPLQFLGTPGNYLRNGEAEGY